VLTREPAQELVHRHAQRLAADVPEREVDRALRVQLLARRRVEVGAVHELPEVLDPRRVLADDQARELLDHVAAAALADAGEALVRLDRDDRVALVEGRPGLRGLVEAHTRDPQGTHARRRRCGLAAADAAQKRAARAGERPQELALAHGYCDFPRAVIGQTASTRSFRVA
jgi:hypothetical protein